MKTFLYPEAMRRGQPTMAFVTKEQLGRRRETYWLGIYHDFVGRGAPAVVTDYQSVSKTRIRKRTYLALLAEAKANRRRYRVT